MNVQIIKNRLYNNTDAIVKLLNESGFADISYDSNRNEIRCARAKGRNSTSVAVNTKTLGAVSYSQNIYGDIITLIQEKLDYNFVQVIKYMANILNINTDIKYTPPFGGFYHNVCKSCDTEDLDVQTYDDDILNQYMIMPSKMFLMDRITHSIQKEYQVGYDSVTQRITVPWRYSDGRIGGITGRYNHTVIDGDNPKWLSVLPFQKSKFLFGYTHNYNSIIKSKKCVITESEKGTMQLASYGFNIGLSTGGSHLNSNTVSLLSTLNLNKAIIAFDEGLSEDLIRIEAQKIKDSLADNVEVGYIFDRDNSILTRGDKESPTDLGKDSFIELCNKCIVYI